MEIRIGERLLLARENFPRLIEALHERGYEIIAPTVRDEAIIYDRIDSVSDLPKGWTDEQNAGAYRLHRGGSERLFDFAVGPHSWKRFLRPPYQLLMQSLRRNGEPEVAAPPARKPEKLAFLGVRACEVHAISILDRVFLNDQHRDVGYETLRSSTLLIAVPCARPGGTCFCSSMNTGPGLDAAGYDLALTEIGDPPHYVMEPRTAAGADILSGLPHRPATGEELHTAEYQVETAKQQMGRTLDTEGIQDLLYRNYDNRRWDQTASRCLTCTNCTMVCPTCFCSTVEDTTDLAGETAERRRRWDSCFTLDFSYIHGGAVRASVKSRYRQWLVHKLAAWIDQFGRSGCVGCGRCITWCPVGIDITEEVRAIRETERLARSKRYEDDD